MSDRALVAIPASIDESLGEAALQSIDEHLLQPSALSDMRRQQISAAFEAALAAQPRGSVPVHRLVFRKSRLGPNAFALPGGTMVLTDELVELVKGDTAVITGVLAHELGHVRQRHGMRMLIQASAIGVLASVVVGDFNSLLAAVPVLIGQASYSRDAEREADAESVRVMKAAGISPAAMLRFFEAVAGYRETRQRGKDDAASAPAGTKPGGDSWLGIAIASHPADTERVQFFRDAAAR
jgi:Zn-dependent protease with chaperone function